MVPVILKLSKVGDAAQSLTIKAADAEAGSSARRKIIDRRLCIFLTGTIVQLMYQTGQYLHTISVSNQLSVL